MLRDALIVAALLSLAAGAWGQDEPAASVVGTWTADDEEAEAELIFREDGTFTRTITTADGQTYVAAGTYRLAGDVIIVEVDDELIAVKFRLISPTLLELNIPEEGVSLMERADARDEQDEADPPARPLVTERPQRPTRRYQPPDPPLTGEETLSVITRHGLDGFMDADGQVRIEPQFEAASPFHDGRARVQLNGRWGYLEPSGAMGIAPQYSAAGSFSEGRAWVEVDGKYGFIDVDGAVVIEPTYEDVIGFNEGLSAVMRDGKWGFIDQRGKIVIEPTYDDAYSFHEGLAAVQTGGEWGFVNPAGEGVIEPRFARAGPFAEGLAPAQETEDGPLGYIEKTGAWVVEPTYEEAEGFSDGLARVRKDGKHGYIDPAGKVAVPLELTYAGDFADGLAAAEKGTGNYCYIDKAGKTVFDAPEDATFVYAFHDGLAHVSILHLYGLVNAEGTLLYDPLVEIRPWADLARSSPSILYGDSYSPIPARSRNMAERYLTGLRDTRRRPVYYEFDREIDLYGSTGLLYQVLDQDGREHTLVFELKPGARQRDMLAPPGLFLPSQPTDDEPQETPED